MTQNNDTDPEIWAALTDCGGLETGTAEVLEPVPSDRERVKTLAGKRSAPFVMVRTHIETDMDIRESGRLAANTVMDEEHLRELAHIIEEGVPVEMTVTRYRDTYYYLQPKPEWLRGVVCRVARNRMPEQYSYLAGSAAGMEFLTRVTGCRYPLLFVEILQPLGDVDKKELSYMQFTELMMAQPEDTYVQITVGETLIIKNKYGKEEPVRAASMSGYEHVCVVLESYLNPDLCLPDGSIVLKAGVSRDGKQFVLTDRAGKVFNLPYAPPDMEKYDLKNNQDISVKGTVMTMNHPTNLLEAVFDNGTWRSGVFLRHPDGNVKLPADLIKAARMFIRTGYPCEFQLEISRYDKSSSMLKLPGFWNKLYGRVRSSIELNALKKGQFRTERMAPAAVVGDEIMMVSAGYTAFMKMDVAPEPLLLMARAGIFSPSYQMMCEISVLKDPEGMMKLQCVPASRDYRNVTGIGKRKVRICCAVPGYLMLMVDDMPAMSCRLEHHRMMSLLKATRSIKWNVDRDFIVRPWLKLTPDSGAVMDELTPGAFFELEHESTYRGAEVYIYPEGEKRRTSTLMMALGVDNSRHLIIATDRLQLFDTAKSDSLERLRMLPDMLEHGLVVLRMLDGKLGAYITVSDVERTVFSRLHTIYGNNTTAIMKHSSSTKPFLCRWTGVACQYFYLPVTGIISADVARLWAGLEDDVPVLFGDVPLSRNDLPQLPALPEEKVEDRRDAAGIPHTRAAQVIKAEEDSVSFLYRGRREVIRGRENLRIPLAESQRGRTRQTPLNEIFRPADWWLLDESDPGNLKLYSHNDSLNRVYNVVGKLNNDEWILRDDAGAVAVSDSIEDVTGGDRILVAPDDMERGVLYTKVVEENFIGRKLRLVIEALTEKAAVCREMSGLIKRRIELPFDRVSWNPHWTPVLLRPGIVLTACVVDVEPDLLIVDRRVLLHQDALYTGISPEEGLTYQMEVKEVQRDGYLLDQNGVSLKLPFEKASMFKITPFNTEYLVPGDLVAVKADGEGGADWIPTRKDDIKAIIDETYAHLTYTFTVHHHCPTGLFIERRGLLLFMPNRMLGYWAGRSLHGEFPAGSTLAGVSMRPDGAKIKVEFRNPPLLPDPGFKIGARVEGCISHVYPGYGCYVDCEGFPVYVPAEAIDNGPVSVDGELSVEVGQMTELRIEGVFADDGVIIGNMAALKPRYDFEGPRLQKFSRVLDKEISTPEGQHAVLADGRGYPATLPFSDGLGPKDLEPYIQGAGYFFVTGLTPEKTYSITYAPLFEARKKMLDIYNSRGTSQIYLEAVVIDDENPKFRVLLSGHCLLKLPRKMSKTPEGQTWTADYAVGTNHRVRVIDSGTTYFFIVSDKPDPTAAEETPVSAPEMEIQVNDTRDVVETETAPAESVLMPDEELKRFDTLVSTPADGESFAVIRSSVDNTEAFVEITETFTVPKLERYLRAVPLFLVLDTEPDGRLRVDYERLLEARNDLALKIRNNPDKEIRVKAIRIGTSSRSFLFQTGLNILLMSRKVTTCKTAEEFEAAYPLGSEHEMVVTDCSAGLTIACRPAQ